MTFHFFPDGTLSFLGLFLLFSEQFLLAGEDLLHFFLEVEVLVALDGLIILDSLRVELDEIADDIAGGCIRKLEFYLVVQQTLGIVFGQLQLIIPLHYNLYFIRME